MRERETKKNLLLEDYREVTTKSLKNNITLQRTEKNSPTHFMSLTPKSD